MIHSFISSVFFYSAEHQYTEHEHANVAIACIDNIVVPTRFLNIEPTVNQSGTTVQLCSKA